MSKKILTVLAPVAAIVAFMAVPSLAQAGIEVQCGSSECANGATLRGQSSNLQTTTQNPSGDLSCTGSTFEGTLTENQTAPVLGSVTLDTLTGCKANGISADIKTNATTTHPWQLEVQQPVSGQITGHLKPNSQQQYLEFTVQIQVFGGSVATCTFGSHGLQLMGTVQSDSFSIEGTNQFTLIARSGFSASECGTVGTTTGDLTGDFQLETTSGSAVVLHHVAQ